MGSLICQYTRCGGDAIVHNVAFPAINKLLVAMPLYWPAFILLYYSVPDTCRVCLFHCLVRSHIEGIQLSSSFPLVVIYNALKSNHVGFAKDGQCTCRGSGSLVECYSFVKLQLWAWSTGSPPPPKKTVSKRNEHSLTFWTISFIIKFC